MHLARRIAKRFLCVPTSVQTFVQLSAHHVRKRLRLNLVHKAASAQNPAVRDVNGNVSITIASLLTVKFAIDQGVHNLVERCLSVVMNALASVENAALRVAKFAIKT